MHDADQYPMRARMSIFLQYQREQTEAGQVWSDLHVGVDVVGECIGIGLWCTMSTGLEWHLERRVYL